MFADIKFIQYLQTDLTFYEHTEKYLITTTNYYYYYYYSDWEGGVSFKNGNYISYLTLANLKSFLLLFFFPWSVHILHKITACLHGLLLNDEIFQSVLNKNTELLEYYEWYIV